MTHIAPHRFRREPNLAPASTGDELVTGLAKIAKALDERPALVQQALGSGAIPCAMVDGTFAATRSALDVEKRQIQAVRTVPDRLPGGPCGYRATSSLVR